MLSATVATRYSQDDRPMRLETPLGRDKLLLTGFSGQEELSRLFHFDLEVFADAADQVAFEDLIGKSVSVTMRLPEGADRFFNGVVARIAELDRRELEPGVSYTLYRLHVVPAAWLLTRRRDSRIFQHQSVPEILKQVFEGLDVSWELRGSYEPRNYCAQYRETDFDFVSRLMEEEGIYFFFSHSQNGHRMVVADTPSVHPLVVGESRIEFEDVEGGYREGNRILTWEKSQALTSGKYLLWDNSFEMPRKPLEASKEILTSAQVGTVTHKLKVAGNEKLEVYDYPGGYAKRFDGVAPGGGSRSGDVQKIMQDNGRTVAIRMQQETMPAVQIQGTSNCPQLGAGQKFKLDNHFNADGDYVLTSVSHAATEGGYTAGSSGFRYANSFSCIPLAIPFRPIQRTPKPTVSGCQTATVVGPSGEEIFTDKYGRVRVQFHWDREGSANADSSCWVRVGTSWAGKQWGAIHIPRIGQEVIVDFIEGDPDRPIVVGSVYNAELMPPYTLPDNRTQSGLKTRSTPEGSPENFNELRFEDKKDAEQIYLHAERNLDTVVEDSETREVGFGRDTPGTQTLRVNGDQKFTIAEGHQFTTIEKGDQTFQITEGKQTITIKGDQSLTVQEGNQTIKVGGNREDTVSKDETTKIDGKRSVKVAKTDELSVGKTLTIDAADEIVLKSGMSSITMKKNGDITISGVNIKVTGNSKVDLKATAGMTLKSDAPITIEGTAGVTTKGLKVALEAQVQADIKGVMTTINGTAMLKMGGGITMIG
jgi:type VI secretion system secreted protein VgrG